MSHWSEHYQYHLTPRGWIDGTADYGGGAADKKPIPEDTVLTRIRYEKQTHITAPIDISYSDQPVSSDTALVKELLDKFGEKR